MCFPQIVIWLEHWEEFNFTRCESPVCAQEDQHNGIFEYLIAAQELVRVIFQRNRHHRTQAQETASLETRKMGVVSSGTLRKDQKWRFLALATF